MDIINYNDVEVDRYEKCHGLFFDYLEQETRRSMEGAASFDIGNEFVGARFNEILDVGCPKCQTKMEYVLPTDPFEIKFNCCPSCKSLLQDPPASPSCKPLLQGNLR
jgi:uncharacterized protein